MQVALIYATSLRLDFPRFPVHMKCAANFRVFLSTNNNKRNTKPNQVFFLVGDYWLGLRLGLLREYDRKCYLL